MNANYDDGRTDREKELLPEWSLWPISFLLGAILTVAMIGVVLGLIYVYRNYQNAIDIIMSIAAFVGFSTLFGFWIRAELN